MNYGCNMRVTKVCHLLEVLPCKGIIPSQRAIDKFLYTCGKWYSVQSRRRGEWMCSDMQGRVETERVGLSDRGRVCTYCNETSPLFQQRAAPFLHRCRGGAYALILYTRSQNCEKRLLASCLSVRPSVPMEHLRYHWTDFHEILYLSVFRKSLKKIQV